jgi:hypothetical protein
MSYIHFVTIKTSTASSVMRKKNPKYYPPIERLSETTWMTHNYKAVHRCCEIAMNRLDNRVIVGGYGLGKTVALTDFAAGHDGVTYCRLRMEDLSGILSDVASSLLPTFTYTDSLTALNLIADTAKQRPIKLLILDNFSITEEMTFTASLLCDCLRDSTGVILSISYMSGGFPRIIAPKFWITFFERYVTKLVSMREPSSAEIRSIALDRGAPLWVPLQKCKSFVELDQEIEALINSGNGKID